MLKLPFISVELVFYLQVAENKPVGGGLHT